VIVFAVSSISLLYTIWPEIVRIRSRRKTANV
jgi:hypothetical protein